MVRISGKPEVEVKPFRNLGPLWIGVFAEIGYFTPGEDGWPAGLERRGVAMYVRDNGIGIAEKHHESISRMFKRLHERDAFGGGTGVGLTIVKKIVERHAGQMTVASVPAVGTAFFFSPQTPRERW